MAPESSFETMCFNPFLANDSLNDSNQNPGVNFYNNISSLDSNYLSSSEIDENFNNFSTESFSVPHLNIRSRNKLFEAFPDFYRPPIGDLNVCETFFKKILSDSSTVNKTFFLAGDFNINFLDFETNKKVQSFVNLMFEFSMIPTINKPTRVTKHTATAIDNIITNCIINSDFKSAIVKTDLSDHFPIIFINELMRVPTPTDDMENCVYKRDFTENALNCFKQALFETSWDSVKNLKQPNEAYNKFLEIFTELYEEYFPIRKIKIKPKRALRP